MSFNTEGIVATTVAAARFANLIRPSSEFLQKLPKITVSWVDPFIFIPSLWIQADRKKARAEDFYEDLDVEVNEARRNLFLKMTGLPGPLPHDLECTDIAVASFVSLLTQDPAVYFELETEGDQVHVEVAAAFVRGTCRFVSGYDIGEGNLFWLEEGAYKTLEWPPYFLGEKISGIREALKYMDPEFATIRDVFHGFLPTRPIGELRPLEVVSHRIDLRAPRITGWPEVFPRLGPFEN
jgi:hypothetical protein